jgi:FixJ family two-component response regulator
MQPKHSRPEMQRRLTEQGYPLPIIFNTAFPDAKVRAEALAAGALGFFGQAVQ